MSRRLYFIWDKMYRRCHVTTEHNFPRYGGRGIRVCDEWLDSFVAFRDWALANGYAEGLTLDRKENDKGYSPDNCRWATRTEQNRNRSNFIGANVTLKVRLPSHQLDYAKAYAKTTGTTISKLIRGFLETLTPESRLI